jgi:type IV secretion system protein TrbF
MKQGLSSWRANDPAETAYHKARQEWDRRMGTAVVQARNWRLLAFGELGLLGLASIGLIVLGAQPKAIPHLVEVDKLGAASYLGAVDRAALADFKPPLASLQYHLRRFVSDTREISSDSAVLKRNWLDAYKLVTANAGNALSAYVRDNDPFKQLDAQVRISIQVNVIVPISRDSWQVDWTETTSDDHGNPLGTAVWRGTFRVLLKVPQSDEELALNPLGLFIDEFHWARLSDAGRTSSP